jgi:hypothetical protein
VWANNFGHVVEFSEEMTANAIVDKLRAALSDAVDSECKVVYILAESRKLLESYPPDPLPFALKLYCHWALHVDLESPGTTLPFLKRVDNYVAGLLVAKEDLIEAHAMMREFVLLDTFKQQFRKLLQAFNLPTEICDDDKRWQQFLKHYAGVIEDGSLSCEAKTQRLKLVKEVIFGKGRRALSHDFYAPFDLAWTIVLLDRRKVTVEVNASASKTDDISFVATLS